MQIVGQITICAYTDLFHLCLQSGCGEWERERERLKDLDSDRVQHRDRDPGRLPRVGEKESDRKLEPDDELELLSERNEPNLHKERKKQMYVC